MANEKPGAVIGRKVRELREAGMFTRTELAERSGLSEQGIASLESGRSARPRRGTIEKAARGLGIDVETLIEGAVGEAPKATAPPSPTEEQERRNDSLRAQELRRWAEVFHTLADRRKAALEQARPEDLAALVHESIFIVNGANTMKRRTLDPEAVGGSQAVLDAAAEADRALRELEDALYAISDEAERHNAVAPGAMDELAELRRQRKAG